MSSRLESLPAELLLHIADHIPRPSDLKSLCLTSKLIRVPATTVLYREIVFDYRTPTWISFKPDTGMLSKANPGLAQIRHLTFNASMSEVAPEEVQAMTAVLNSLPKNTLRSIDCLQFPIDEKLAVQLITQQPSIFSLALGPLTCNLKQSVDLGLLGSSVFANVKDLCLPMTAGSIHDFELYQWLIARAPLRRLTIATTSSLDSLPAGLSDTDESNGVLSKTLFSHVRDRVLPPAQVECLVLDEINLQHAHRSFARYIDLSHLRSLELHDCAGTDVFIRAMTDGFEDSGCCKLEHFAYAIKETDHIDYKVVEKVLRICSGLKSLMMVGMDDFKNFDLKLLEKHGSTLRSLAVYPNASDDGGSQPMGLAQDFYATVVEHCQNLRELALQMPDVLLCMDSANTSPYFDSVMVDLLKLPVLKSLRIFNWPSPGTVFLPNENSDEVLAFINQRNYLFDVDAFASTHLASLVNKGRTKSAPVICFAGFQGDIVHEDRHWIKISEPVCYVPLKQYDVFGRPQLGLQKMSINDVKYFEPESKILYWPYEIF
ncbi:hypothetical protein PRZ48_003101 [Zasmidium cellare]|uniref:F-box domain-containing protein n=1 Tax=Zasmidium cellare TaxID=395010 RepID=A0ABR0EVN5_ZASCE|nr:hypothetical protein PRZ48_003101 [Zasmidium cellare]